MAVISLFSLIGTTISCVLLLFLLEHTTAAIFAAQVSFLAVSTLHPIFQI